MTVQLFGALARGEVLRGYLGGAGLGTWLLHRLGPPGVEPRAPEAPLAFIQRA